MYNVFDASNLIFTQNGSNNKINLTVTQESGVTYTGPLVINLLSVCSLFFLKKVDKKFGDGV